MSWGGARQGAGRKHGLAKPLTNSELETAQGLLQGGQSLESAALEISRLRGANSAITPEVRRRRSISARTLARQLPKAGTNQVPAEIKASQELSVPRHVAGDRAIRAAEPHQEGSS